MSGSGEDISRNNVYRAKHPWPPNFSDLSNAEKYRYERKYKRRVRLATARPAWWMRSTGMLQFASVTVLPVYFIFFHDYGHLEKENPFRPAKEWMRQQMASFWGPMPTRTEIRRQDPKLDKTLE